jgi:hypothetical protein
MTGRRRAVLVLKALIWISAALVTGGVVVHAERQRVLNDLAHVGAHLTFNAEEQPVSVYVHGAELTRSHLEGISGWSHLNAIAITNCQVDAESLPALYELSELRVLELTFLDCPSGTLRGLNGSGQLLEVRLIGCRWVDDAEIEHLLELRRLRSLNLAQTSVTDAGLARLAVLPELRELTINGCEGVTDAGLLTVARLPALQRLYAEELNVQPETYDALRAARPSLWLRPGTLYRPTGPVAGTPGS